MRDNPKIVNVSCFFLTTERIEQIAVGSKGVISLTRQLNPNKATCSDGISPHMLLLCDESLVLPLKIILSNILSTVIYLETCKRNSHFQKKVTNN